MPDSKYKIVKDRWGTRVNFQTCYGLGMTSEDLEEGDRILAQMQRVDAIREQQYAQRENESDWARGNRERYEAGGRSLLKEAAAECVAKEYDFTPTGDPEMDMMVAIGLRDMESDPESDHMVESRETTGSSSNAGGADRAPEGKEVQAADEVGKTA